VFNRSCEEAQRSWSWRWSSRRGQEGWQEDAGSNEENDGSYDDGEIWDHGSHDAGISQTDGGQGNVGWNHITSDVYYRQGYGFDGEW
jgi:hypothetical protein